MTIKKATCIVLSVILAVIPMMMLSSCTTIAMVTQKELPKLETEYFYYSVKTEDDGSQRAYLVGFTELGLEQTELIFPEEIGGIKVWGVGYTLPRWTGEEQFGRFQSLTLEKLFFPFSYNEKYWAYYNCWVGNAYVVKWYPQADGAAIINVSGKASIYGFNIYKNEDKEDFQSNNCRVANVSYLYNYDDSPNDGWYWVDSYDEDLITYIPPEPEREGYAFAGWYKESECTNPWDFEHDITGKELVIEAHGQNVYDTYEGIYLYAKWNKI